MMIQVQTFDEDVLVFIAKADQLLVLNAISSQIRHSGQFLVLSPLGVIKYSQER